MCGPESMLFFGQQDTMITQETIRASSSPTEAVAGRRESEASPSSERTSTSSLPPPPPSSRPRATSGPASRPPLVPPPQSQVPRPPATPVEIPKVRSDEIETRVSQAVQPSETRSVPQRLTGIEGLQKRLANEQKARHRAEEQNMMMRIELSESRKEIAKLKRELAQLMRQTKHQKLSAASLGSTPSSPRNR